LIKSLAGPEAGPGSPEATARSGGEPVSLAAAQGDVPFGRHRGFLKSLSVDRWLYLMILPGVIYFVIFRYGPIWGVTVAFKDYQPFLGYWKSGWVGLQHFSRLFSEPTFLMLLRNTLVLSLYSLTFFFPLPIVLALLLNETGSLLFKRSVQTLIYVPHFMSWVVIAGISYVMFTTRGGIVNGLLRAWFGVEVPFLTSAAWFRPLIVAQIIWRETGWGTIIFMAALAGVDPQLYEAAYMDGANRWRQLWSITLPSIRSTIVILLILRLGHMLDTGFEQIFLMLNALNRDVGEVFDTYVYQTGIVQGQYGYSAAVGFFKSIVSLALVAGANQAAKRVGEEGIF
jgi:putative aldouronate transport system permease protein